MLFGPILFALLCSPSLGLEKLTDIRERFSQLREQPPAFKPSLSASLLQFVPLTIDKFPAPMGAHSLDVPVAPVYEKVKVEGVVRRTVPKADRSYLFAPVQISREEAAHYPVPNTALDKHTVHDYANAAKVEKGGDVYDDQVPKDTVYHTHNERERDDRDQNGDQYDEEYDVAGYDDPTEQEDEKETYKNDGQSNKEHREYDEESRGGGGDTHIFSLDDGQTTTGDEGEENTIGQYNDKSIDSSDATEPSDSSDAAGEENLSGDDNEESRGEAGDHIDDDEYDTFPIDSDPADDTVAIADAYNDDETAVDADTGDQYNDDEAQDFAPEDFAPNAPIAKGTIDNDYFALLTKAKETSHRKKSLKRKKKRTAAK